MLFFFLFGFYVIQNYLCDEYTRSETNQPADIYCFFPNLCVVVTKSNFKYLKNKTFKTCMCFPDQVCLTAHSYHFDLIKGDFIPKGQSKEM